MRLGSRAGSLKCPDRQSLEPRPQNYTVLHAMDRLIPHPARWGQFPGLARAFAVLGLQRLALGSGVPWSLLTRRRRGCKVAKTCRNQRDCAGLVRSALPHGALAGLQHEGMLRGIMTRVNWF